jgi:release factor glutamine methyltransferase
MVIERVAGRAFVVLPDVLNPVVFRSGAMLAEAIASAAFAAPTPAVGERNEPMALDMGTGTGIGAVFAATRGYRVIGVDTNPEAVRCARINVGLNRLEARIEIRQGDLFEPVAGERFDLVLFNPPFFRGAPKTLHDMAWRSTDVPERFAAGLTAALSPHGRALILLSTDGDAAGVLGALTDHGLQVELVLRRHFGNEIMMIYAARRQG